MLRCKFYIGMTSDLWCYLFGLKSCSTQLQTQNYSDWLWFCCHMLFSVLGRTEEVVTEGHYHTDGNTGMFWIQSPRLTVLFGQLYFSKMSWARSSPPSVNIIIILLQFALGALVSCEKQKQKCIRFVWRVSNEPGQFETHRICLYKQMLFFVKTVVLYTILAMCHLIIIMATYTL